MRYLGGKSKIAKQLAARILALTPSRAKLIEPFIGGAGMTSELAPHFGEVDASDAHEDLVLMWQALLNGWEPPTSITENEYKALKLSDPSALRGFAGFGVSWGGKWFGGYARGRGANYAGESARSVTKQRARMPNVTVRHCTFNEVNVKSGDVVYCDPPYAHKTGYGSAFCTVEFWAKARAWAKNGADVFVSEYFAPQGWPTVWSHTKVRDLKSKLTNSENITEKLFHLTPFD